MASLRVMIKRTGGKKQQEETEKQQHVIATENNLLKILQQKVFEITTRSSPTSLIVASHGIDSGVTSPDSWPAHPQRHLYLCLFHRF